MIKKMKDARSDDAYRGIHEAISEAAKHAFQDHRIWVPPELLIPIKDKEFFEKNINMIKREYGSDNYVAIYHEEIIDTDKNKLDLEGRVKKRHPNESFFISNVNTYLRLYKELKKAG